MWFSSIFIGVKTYVILVNPLNYDGHMWALLEAGPPAGILGFGPKKLYGLLFGTLRLYYFKWLLIILLYFNKNEALSFFLF